MIMPALFCYELTEKNEWEPVVYFGGLPTMLQVIARTETVEVPAEFIDQDTPNFGRLKKAFPAPNCTVGGANK